MPGQRQILFQDLFLFYRSIEKRKTQNEIGGPGQRWGCRSCMRVADAFKLSLRRVLDLKVILSLVLFFLF